MRRFRQIFDRRPARRHDLARDAGLIYQLLMQAARRPSLFAKGCMDDSYEGRLDMLALHLAALQSALRRHAVQGERLAQAVFDHMVSDFDIALREEGLTDSGVKRRIKPIVAYVYGRVKDFEQSLDTKAGTSPELGSALGDILNRRIETSPQFLEKLGFYFQTFARGLKQSSLGEIASGHVNVPQFPSGAVKTTDN